MSKLALLAAFLLASACAFTAPAAAQVPYGQRQFGVLPLDRVLPQVRSGRPGRFYDAEGPFPDANGNFHYRIKWLTPEGRVVWLDADARSGHVLGVARGDWREQGPPSFGGEGDFRPNRGFGPPPPPPGRGMGGGWRGRPGNGRGRRGF